MLNIVVRRLVAGAALLVVVSALTFVLVALIPGDAASNILGPGASEAQLETLRHQLGLDLPLWQRYLDWAVAAVQGDLGTSIVSPQPVATQLGRGLEVSIPLAFGAVLVGSLIGVAVGVFAAVEGRWLSKALDVLVLVGMALPTFWVALLLSSVVGVQLGWLPATGFVSFDDDPVGWLRSLALPVAALCVGGIAMVSKQTRDSVDETLSRDFIDALRVEGASPRRILFGHVLRNAAIPTVAVLGALFISALSGAVLVESVFGLPGLGSIAVRATSTRDVPVIVGVAVYFCLVVIVVNLVLDVVYALINPKVRVRS